MDLGEEEADDKTSKSTLTPPILSRTETTCQRFETGLDTLAAVAEKLREEMLLEDTKGFIDEDKKTFKIEAEDMDSQSFFNQELNATPLGCLQYDQGRRSVLSKDQRMILRSFYSKNSSPIATELEEIIKKCGLPRRVVQVWFQNRRARDRQRERIAQAAFARLTITES